MNYHGCIAHPCPKPRKKDSGFCAKHLAQHEASPWVKAWRKYQKEVAKHGIKDVLWSPP